MEYRPCNAGCESTMISNGVCNYQCFTSSCNYDIPDCDSCSKGCNLSLLLNLGCDDPCNNSACFYDNMVCTCSPDCFPDMINNGICNSPCNSKACFYDGDDCTFENSSYVSTSSIIGLTVISVSFILILAVIIWYFYKLRSSNSSRVSSGEPGPMNVLNEIDMRFPEDPCSRENIGEICPICLDR